MVKVSVIIPTHQRANIVTESIDSVLAQTYDDFEIIVIDDSSSDNTREALQHYVDSNKIRYFYIEARSVSRARNLGIQHAKGEIIAFLDSDDLFTPQKLEIQVEYLNKYPELGLIHGGFSKFDQNRNDLGYRDTSKLSGWIYPDLFLEWSVLIMTSTVMVHASTLKKIGEFDNKLIHGEDLDLWGRIARHYAVLSIPEKLTQVRVHPGNLSGDFIKRPELFTRLLTKTFDADPELSGKFKRRAMAKMLANSGKNFLGEGRKVDMKHTRKYSLRSIAYWPFQLEAYVSIVVSIFGQDLRKRLYAIWNDYKYKSTNAIPD